MSWWQRFRSRISGPSSGQPLLPARPSLPPPDDDPVLFLHRYSQRLGHLSERPLTADAAVLSALTKLLEAGREEPAIRMGQSLSRAIPTDFALARLVAETLCQRHRYAEALGPLSQALRLAPLSESLRLRFLLAQVHRELGQIEQSRRQFAEILALDVDYPEARAGLAEITDPQRSIAQRSDSDGMGNVQRAILPTVALATGGRYLLLAELGVGRTGTVYRALDRELDCELALKLFHPHLRQRGDDDALLRALHEARLLSAARHPGIVALYAVEGDELGDSEQLPLLAMELCRGGSLRSRVRTGPLAVEVALCRSWELLETLAELHAGSVSHGDLKPENLLFRGDCRCRFELPPSERPFGDLVIADFGLSRLRDGLGGTGVGTLGYLSRERYLGGPPSPPGDVFAVGVVLVEMLCGERVTVELASASRMVPLSGSAVLSGAQPWLSRLGVREQPLRRLLADLLHEDASVRPTAVEAACRLSQLLRQGD